MYLAAYEKERSRFKDLCGTTVFVDVKPSDIVDASARSLNIEKLASTLDLNKDGKLFD